MSVTFSRSPAWGVVDRPGQGEHGGTLYAARLTEGGISILQGPAAAVCRAALTGADGEGVARLVAADLDVAPEDVDLEVMTEVLDELVSLGVLIAMT